MKKLKLALIILLVAAAGVFGQDSFVDQDDDFDEPIEEGVTVRISLSASQISSSGNAVLKIRVTNPTNQILRSTFSVFLSGKQNYWSPGKNQNYPQDQDIIFVDPRKEKVVTLSLSGMKWGFRYPMGKPNMRFYQIAKPGRWIMDMELNLISLHSGTAGEVIKSNNVELFISASLKLDTLFKEGEHR